MDLTFIPPFVANNKGGAASDAPFYDANKANRLEGITFECCPFLR